MKTQVKRDSSGYKEGNLVDTDKVLSKCYAKAQITVEVVNEPLAHRYDVDLY